MAISDPRVWSAVAVAILFFAALLLIGLVISRGVGLQRRDAGAGSTVGIATGASLLVVTSWWAAIASGGRSSFTPVAIGFLAATALAGLQWVRGIRTRAASETGPAPQSGRDHRDALRLAVAFGVGSLFLLAVALLYASTITPGPREGVQPIEFMDQAFYSVLADHLRSTGIETTYAPSGFDGIGSLPQQTWYHWGEIWTAAAVLEISNLTPLAARYFVVLPVLLLAASCLTGAVVQATTRTNARGAFWFGALACLLLAPIPFVFGDFFSHWAAGGVFWVTLYGLTIVAVPFAAYGLLLAARGPLPTSGSAFIGTSIAFVMPAHIVIALLLALATGAFVVVRVARRYLANRSTTLMPPGWRPIAAWAAGGLVATAIWGVASGHALGGTGGSVSVPAFNATWLQAIGSVVLGSGVFALVVVVIWTERRRHPLQTDVYLALLATLAISAVIWGALIGDFNMFHVFFGALALFGTTATATATWTVLKRAREAGRNRVAIALVVLVAIQIEVLAVFTLGRLQGFGPDGNRPVPVALLDTIRTLPSEARVGYSCAQTEEVGFWDARLLAITAHTARPVIPMCFQGEVLSLMVGGMETSAMSPLFQAAPQRALYPDATTEPTPDAVHEFMKSHGIDYVYVDAEHPNRLAPDGRVLFDENGFELLQLR